jgi:nucleotide-binding universal stress UspA family protein
MPATSRIVVGVDDTEEAKTALRWAIDQAALTGGRVEVVYAWERSHLVPVRGAATVTVPDEEYQAVADQFLADLLAKLAPSPGLDLSATALEGEPDEILARRRSSVLVVDPVGRPVGRLLGVDLVAALSHSRRLGVRRRPGPA